MQNRFRFRMYNNKTKVMIYDVETINDRFVSFSDNKDIILMQCTGLKDKNGKLIYEGDIIKDYRLDRTLVIKFDKGKFIAFDKEIGTGVTLDILSEAKEVVGNEYENPELVEKANEMPIIVKFNRRQLKQCCKNHNLKLCKSLKCKMTDKDLIKCNLIFNTDFEIVEE